jgi:hypothetical protein
MPKKVRENTTTSLPESPITNVKVLVYRGDSIAEEITLASLGTLIADALKPILKDEIQTAVRDYFKNIQW